MNTNIPLWSAATRGLCPQCLREVPATLAQSDDNRIHITQICPKHGESSALIASDAAEYLRLRQYVPARLAGIGCCGGDGTSKPIEQVRAGDFVLSRNEQTGKV